MTKKPKQMLLQHWITTACRIKKRCVKVSISQKHCNCTGQNWQGQQQQNSRYEKDQTNKGIRCIYIPGARMFRIVVIKLTAPIIDEAPARCRLKIARSTDGPECAWTEANGG